MSLEVFLFVGFTFLHLKAFSQSSKGTSRFQCTDLVYMF